MDVKEQVFEKLQSAVWQMLNAEQMEVFRDAYYLALDGYDIHEVETHVVKYDGGDMELFQRFFIAKAVQGLSPNSLKYYKSVLDAFFRAVGKHIKDVNTDDVRIYLAKMRADKLSCKSMNNVRRVLSSFYKWLQNEEIIVVNPMNRVGMIHEPNIKEKALTEQQMEALRQSCASLRDEAIVEFLYSTGCRVSEVCQLNRIDVDFQSFSVVVIGKGNKSRTVFMSPRAAYKLRAYLDARTDNYDALFAWDLSHVRIPDIEKRLTEMTKGEPGRLTSAGIRGILKKCTKKLDVRVHPHLLRKTVATHALRNGMPIDQVQKMLGHEQINTTLIYAQTDSQDVAISHQKYVH